MRHYGFNLLPMFGKRCKKRINNRELDFIAAHGFNTVRLPLNYAHWTRDFDYMRPDERVLELVDGYVAQCLKRGLHVFLNLHRAPGYCINRLDRERHILWVDQAAQDAFVFNWDMFARRYKDIPPEQLSFNLVNEPGFEGEKGFTRERHAAVMRRAIAAIHAVTPGRGIVLDGIAGGDVAIPELMDTGATLSTRGYAPHHLSFYKARWCDVKVFPPEPAHPLNVNGVVWDRARLAEFYAPWREMEKAGARVMVGEFGCYNKIPNTIALAWLGDLFSLYREYGWGYLLWNFKGAFGVVKHGRPGTVYTRMGGFDVDAELLAMLKEHRACAEGASANVQCPTGK